MSTNIIDEKLKTYSPKTKEDEENALKEILQEIAIYALSNAGFFEKALFQGGTSLRILYGLPRFSEDLDFILMNPDRNFQWETYIDTVANTFQQFGIHPEITDKSRLDNSVKKMFLKDNSIGKMIDLTFAHQSERKLTIKFEIDINPPGGSHHELKFLEFPLDFSIVAQDLPSNFGGKCHALLCRKYLKGRDWYDFSWYVSKKIIPNFVFLKEALEQQGPWENQKIPFNTKWFLDVMEQKIQTIHWQKAAEDVEPFLNELGKQSLKLWSEDFFKEKLNKLAALFES